MIKNSVIFCAGGYSKTLYILIFYRFWVLNAKLFKFLYSIVKVHLKSERSCEMRAINSFHDGRHFIVSCDLKQILCEVRS